MKNLRRHKDAQISLPLPVPAGLVAGQPVKLGDAGLRGILKTARASADNVLNPYSPTGLAAPGLEPGQATVTLIGVSMTLTYAVAGPVAQFAQMYFAPDGTVSTNAAGGTKLGIALNALDGPGSLEVALM